MIVERCQGWARAEEHTQWERGKPPALWMTYTWSLILVGTARHWFVINGCVEQTAKRHDFIEKFEVNNSEVLASFEKDHRMPIDW